MTLVRGSTETPLFAEDVSLQGLFLATDDPPPARYLVRLRLYLPPFSRELVAHAMPVHSRGSGVGVQLYALDRAARSVWGDFISRVQTGQHAEHAASPLAGAIRFLDPDIE